MFTTGALLVLWGVKTGVQMLNKSADLHKVHRLTRATPELEQDTKLKAQDKAAAQESMGYFVQKDFLLNDNEIQALKSCPLDTACIQVLRRAEDRAQLMQPLLMSTGLAVEGPCGHIHPAK